MIETGEARECHHMALLIGYGASAVNPYLALESVQDLARRGAAPLTTRQQAVPHLFMASARAS